MLFQPFNKATRGETPDFVGAATQEGIFEQRAQAQENALRSQNMLGGMEVYNEMTPNTTPIHDALFGATPETAGTVAETAGGAEALGLADVGAAQMGIDGAAMAGATPLAAPTAATTGAGAGAGTGAAMAAPTAVGAGTAAGAGAAGAGAGSAGLAAMGPVGWAALAAMALGMFG